MSVVPSNIAICFDINIFRNMKIRTNYSRFHTDTRAHNPLHLYPIFPPCNISTCSAFSIYTDIPRMCNVVFRRLVVERKTGDMRQFIRLLGRCDIVELGVA